MTFKTAVWIDPQTEQYCARIFPEYDGIDLAAWGLTADQVEPIGLVADSVKALGMAVENVLHGISPDFPMGKFNPIFLGKQERGFDVRATLAEKLAAIAA